MEDGDDSFSSIHPFLDEDLPTSLEIQEITRDFNVFLDDFHRTIGGQPDNLVRCLLSMMPDQVRTVVFSVILE